MDALVAELRRAGVDLPAKARQLLSSRTVKTATTPLNEVRLEWERVADGIADEAMQQEAQGRTSWLAEHKTPEAVRKFCASSLLLAVHLPFLPSLIACFGKQLGDVPVRRCYALFILVVREILVDGAGIAETGLPKALQQPVGLH
jgi:hypothetical protein